MIHVGLVGYGSQGRRIAEAVSAQKDMRLSGVCLKEPDLSAHMAAMKGFPIYAIDKRDVQAFEKERIGVRGAISDFLAEVDVIVDAAPAGIGKKNKERFYANHKAIFQAGESFDVADIPVFISKFTCATAKKAKYARIPTPHTVALTRVLEPLDACFSVEEVLCTFVNVGSEPMHASLGPVDTIASEKPNTLQLIKDEIDYVMPKHVILSSFRVPSILLSVASIVLRLKEKAILNDVKAMLNKNARTVLLKGEKGLNSTDSIFEYFRRAVRASGDIYEVCVWNEQIEVTNDKVKLVQAFDPHCVQTPEIIDAIRVLTSEEELEESFKRTNEALKLLRPGTYP